MKFGKGVYLPLFLCGLDRSEGEKVVSNSEPQFLKGTYLGLGTDGGEMECVVVKWTPLTRAVCWNCARRGGSEVQGGESCTLIF